MFELFIGIVHRNTIIYIIMYILSSFDIMYFWLLETKKIIINNIMNINSLFYSIYYNIIKYHNLIYIIIV